MWGSDKTFGRGKVIENVLNCSSTCLLNTGSSTYCNISSGTFSAIDLSFSDPKSSSLLNWHVLDSLFDSNHFPILISNSENKSSNYNVPKWRIANADWIGFCSYLEKKLPLLSLSDDVDVSLNLFIHCIISAADLHIGKTSTTYRRKKVPWWNKDCEYAVRQCKKALNRYRRTRNNEDFVQFKKLKARAKYVLKENKKISWREYTSSLKTNTPSAEVWTKIRQMQGRKTSFGIQSISYENIVINDTQRIANLLADTFEQKSKRQYSTNISSDTLTEKASTIKTVQEIDPINTPFTLEELMTALDLCKNTASGPDDIPFIFLKKLSTPCIIVLLKFYNGKSIHLPVKHALYADDLVLFCRGKNTETTCRLMQTAIDNIERCSRHIGLSFSSQKTKIMRFSRKTTKDNPILTYNGVLLDVIDHHKVLGLTFDSRLTWNTHIQETKGNCLKNINILKSLAHFHWGADEEVLLTVYRSIIRSKMDYGSFVYMSASKSHLKALDSVHNTGLRICLGAFRSSPAQSMYCEANEPPLWLRRQHLLLSYAASLSTNPQNPVYQLIIQPNNLINHSQTTRAAQPLSCILNSILDGFDLSATSPFHISTHPPWHKQLPNVNTSLCSFNKHDTPKAVIKQLFLDIRNRNQFRKVLYTDASKNDVGVGSAVVSSFSTTKLIKLPAVCSVYTAELYGIVEAFHHPLLNLIHDIYNKLTDHGVSVTIVWVPSHVGVVGNEAADVAAKEASTLDIPISNIQLHNDIKKIFKKRIYDKWQANWNTTQSHLHDIQPVIPSLELPPMPRRHKVILRRLRLGHTRLTHGFLMASTDPPSCGHCSSLLTVNHFLIECPHFSAKRKQHQLGDNIKAMLTETQKFVNLFNYLKDIEVLSKL
ncbi:uncharacterized protein [Diabrotica undecimpunctata]|uniref:uncharacterized protein n=1 Tax=Diabrotica undecimpunctata TaxID=50387 RepID=UPI003B640FCC